MKIIDYSNFFHNTRGSWKACKKPKRSSDFISYNKHLLKNFGEKVISSEYWYGEDKKGEYVIRSSQHWGGCAGCWWSFYNPKDVNGLKKEKRIKIRKKQRSEQFPREETFLAAKIYLKDLKPQI